MAAYQFIGLALLVSAVGIQSFPTAEIMTLDADAQQRIVHGWAAEPAQWPWQISLRMVNDNGQVSACGGSLIHHRWAMTAAHCTLNRRFLFVRLGLTNLTQPELVIETTVWYEHPLYNPSFLHHDITLISLNRHVVYTPTMSAVRLQPSWRAFHNYNGTVSFASGFGLTNDVVNNGTSSEILNWVHLRLISNEECATYYNTIHPFIINETICAHGLDTLSQSVCQGDSGGPLVILDEDGNYTMVGVSSFVSTAGCSSDFPSGFYRPGPYHDWYLNVTGIDFDWSFDNEVGSGSGEDGEITEIPQEPSENTTIAVDNSTTIIPEVGSGSGEDGEITEIPQEPSENTTIAVDDSTTIIPEVGSGSGEDGEITEIPQEPWENTTIAVDHHNTTTTPEV